MENSNRTRDMSISRIVHSYFALSCSTTNPPTLELISEVQSDVQLEDAFYGVFSFSAQFLPALIVLH